MSYIGTDDYFAKVARGEITGHTAINKYGRNPDIDTADAGTHGTDVWDGGIAGATLWLPPTTARAHNIVSSDDEDGGAGTDTGALTIRIFGLDAAYALQQQDITMNGTTIVDTVTTYTMIYRMYVLTAGSADKNLGTITATAATDGTVTAQIAIINCQTAMAIFQIPAATTGNLWSFYGSIHKAGGAAKLADMILMIKEFGGVWRLQDSFDVSSDGMPYVRHRYSTPIQLPAKSYVKVIGNPSVDEQDVSAGFDMVCVAD